MVTKSEVMTAPEEQAFERIWRVLEEIGTQERHFNTLQATYRGMASGWLLASFSAVGFVISKSAAIDIEPLLLVSGISLAGSVGIALLWSLDLLVYHRLLDSCFIEGLILEDRYSWLPPLRHNMMNTQKEEGVLFRVVGFYIGPIVLLICMCGGALALRLQAIYGPLYAGAAVFMTLVIAFLAALAIRKKTDNTVALRVRFMEAGSSSAG